MLDSFKPGQTEKDRYKTQDQSVFYRTQFPSSAYNTRVSSFATRMGPSRIGSAEPIDKRSSMQATFKQMKSDVTQAESMNNYNIKAKHMPSMSCFLASKHFEIKLRENTPPPEEKPEKGKKDKEKSKKEDLTKESGAFTNKESINSELDPLALARKHMCSENIEKDEEEYERVVESSWA